MPRDIPFFGRRKGVEWGGGGGAANSWNHTKKSCPTRCIARMRRESHVLSRSQLKGRKKSRVPIEREMGSRWGRETRKKTSEGEILTVKTTGAERR